MLDEGGPPQLDTPAAGESKAEADTAGETDPADASDKPDNEAVRGSEL